MLKCFKINIKIAGQKNIQNYQPELKTKKMVGERQHIRNLDDGNYKTQLKPLEMK